MSGDSRTIERATEWLGRATDRRFFLAVFIPVAAVYLATTTWGIGINIDPLTNTYTAWALGTSGTPIVDEYQVPDTHRTFLTWLGAHDQGGSISTYPPGAAVVAAPLYAAFARDLDESTLRRTAAEVEDLDPITVVHPEVWPGSVAAALSAAAGVGFLGLTFRSLTTTSGAIAGSAVVAFGTSVWGVASDALWQHGPSLMWLCLSIWLAQSQRWWGAGFALAAALMSRQLTGVVAAAIGIGAAIGHRSFGPMIRVGLASSLGAVGLSAWYWRWFGTPAPWGARDAQIESAVTAPIADVTFAGDIGGPFSLLENQLLGLFDLRFGVFVLTPILLVALIGVPKAWRIAPATVRAAFVGGIVYYLVQHRIQIYAHSGYLGYRYPLEAFVAMAPMWFLAALSAFDRVPLPSRWAVGISVAIHAVLAVLG